MMRAGRPREAYHGRKMARSAIGDEPGRAARRRAPKDAGEPARAPSGRPRQAYHGPPALHGDGGGGRPLSGP